MSDLSAIEESILGGTTTRRGDAVFVSGEGCWLTDANGHRYLDLGSAQGVAMLGHCHPNVTEAIARQARTLALCPNYLYNDVRARFAEGVPEVEFSGARRVHWRGRELELITDGDTGRLVEQVRRLAPESCSSESLTLEEVFVATLT